VALPKGEALLGSGGVIDEFMGADFTARPQGICSSIRCGPPAASAARSARLKS